jgi:hypothetical protein
MKFRSKIEKILLENTNTIGWVQHDGFRSIEPRVQTVPPTYHHALFDEASSEIARIESTLDTQLPFNYKAFLQEINGAKFFTGEFNTAHFSVSGIWPKGFTPNNTSRGLPNNDILTNNHFSRPVALPTTHFVVGFYAWNGSYACIAPDETTYVRPKNRQEMIHKWSNFEEFVFSELNRLSTHFNTDLKQIDLARETSFIA